MLGWDSTLRSPSEVRSRDRGIGRWGDRETRRSRRDPRSGARRGAASEAMRKSLPQAGRSWRSQGGAPLFVPDRGIQLTIAQREPSQTILFSSISGEAQPIHAKRFSFIERRS